MPSVSLLAHAGLPFHNPLAEADVDAAIAALDLPPGARVAETGCGRAELLLRVLERHPGAVGVGVDLDADAVAQAHVAAAARVPGREPQLIAADAADAGLAPGGFDLVVNVAASHAHGGFPAALDALRALTRPGGLVLYGEGFWAHEPSAAFLDALGGATADEVPLGLEALLAAAAAAGLAPVRHAVATDAGWAAYEEGLAHNAEAIGTEDALAYAARIRERRALPGGTTTLGFALLTLRRDGLSVPRRS